MLNFLLGHRIIVAAITIITGLFFLFFGRTFFRVVAFLVIALGLVLLGCWLCFTIMEHDVPKDYLYLSLALILLAAISVAYLTIRFMIQSAFFCLGARKITLTQLPPSS